MISKGKKLFFQFLFLIVLIKISFIYIYISIFEKEILAPFYIVKNFIIQYINYNIFSNNFILINFILLAFISFFLVIYNSNMKENAIILIMISFFLEFLQILFKISSFNINSFLINFLFIILILFISYEIKLIFNFKPLKIK